ncbi:SNF2-related protein [Pseudactinotalea sp. Z1739]|uniref:DEAD/DEAH box helicase n=1 Tax=Pseudactinotalea sp. Z1739 TaxID=3413028 RepID=UPI003C7AFA20
MAPSNVDGVDTGIELIGIVGPNTFTRGRAYARQGRAEVLEHDHRNRYVAGTCQGSGGRTYQVRAEYQVTSHGNVDEIEGQCTCPVQFDCKHAVALLLTARHHTREPGRAPAHWQSVLTEVFGGPQPATSSLALAVEFDPPAAGAPHHFSWAGRAELGALRVRPMRPGKRKAWVNAGATWSSVRGGHIDGAARSQVDALDALRRMANQSDPWSMGEPTWISLDRIDNPGLWPTLEQIVASGVELVATEYRTVMIEAEPGTAPITVTERDGEIRVGAVLTHPDAPEPGQSLAAIGTPPHGLIWTDDAGLHLAPLTRPASPAWSALHRAGTPVRVPAADRRQFQREVLPHILREVWISPDDSYVPPPPPTPVLHLDVQIATGTDGVPTAWHEPATPQATLTWSVHYRDEDGEGYGPLDLPGEPTDPRRDAEAERALCTRAAALLQPLPGTVDDEGPRSRARVHGLAVVTLIDDVLPQLQEAGVLVTASALPTFTHAGDPTVQVSVTEAGRDWLDLDVTMAVAGREVPISHVITALTRGLDALFLPDGTYVLLDDPELEQLRALLAESRELGDQRRKALRVPRVQVSWWEELLALGLVSASEHEWFRALRQAAQRRPDPPPVPAGLRASLRPYQQSGYEWLATLRRSGLGGILADDMGLGKTVQVLAMILDERTQAANAAAITGGEEAAGSEIIPSATAVQNPPEPAATAPSGPWLVVAPTSVVPNWVAEAAKFTPDLRVAPVNATGARRGRTLADVAAEADVIVTSYALLRLEAAEYAELNVAGLVLDEAQHAKNHTSKAFASAKKVAAPLTFAVTGTPLENTLEELWAMSALVAPGLLGSPAQFRAVYRRPIESGQAQAPDLMSRLRRRIAPFLLRRTKDQVATDLPPKQEQVVPVELNPAHRRVYDKHLQLERQRVLRLVEDLDRNRVEVLAALTRLRQLAIDATLVDPETTAQSSKLEVLLPLLREAAAEGHRVLVFSQFTRYLVRIAERLRAEGVGYAYLDGSTKRRAGVIEGFAKGDDPVFLISLKAGGVGLNLTMADYAVLADPWWNPAVEAQAVDRTHRIGQRRPVMVYRLVATNTIEEKVLALQESKRELVAGVLAEDGEGGTAETAADTGATFSTAPAPARTTGSGALSAAELRELLA